MRAHSRGYCSNARIHPNRRCFNRLLLYKCIYIKKSYIITNKSNTHSNGSKHSQCSNVLCAGWGHTLVPSMRLHMHGHSGARSSFCAIIHCTCLPTLHTQTQEMHKYGAHIYVAVLFSKHLFFGCTVHTHTQRTTYFKLYTSHA